MTPHSQNRRLLTIPNLLSILRISMIPCIYWLYRASHPLACAGMLLLSGVTDLLDGWYARRFGAITDLGKVLDPVADKLTVAAVFFMLVSDHLSLAVPLLLMVIKELVMAVTGILAVARTSMVPGALWHGKVTTALLYATMFVHIIWQEIPSAASNMMAAACTGLMLLSLILYTVDNIRRIRGGRGGSQDVLKATGQP